MGRFLLLVLKMLTAGFLRCTGAEGPPVVGVTEFGPDGGGAGEALISPSPRVWLRLRRGGSFPVIVQDKRIELRGRHVVFVPVSRMRMTTDQQ